MSNKCRELVALGVKICNDNNIGYSQAQRTTIKLGANYKTYCDCSSYVSFICYHVGYLKNNPWFTTFNMIPILKSAGFKEKPLSGDWLPGDVLVRNWPTTQHTEIVYKGGKGGGVTMGAHSPSVPFSEQVSINRYPSKASDWQTLLRPPDSGEPIKWYQNITDQYGALSAKQTYNNAMCTYWGFKALGYTDEATAGIMGNIEVESAHTFNPGQWEFGYHMAPSSGFGLFQFTPSTKYTQWAKQKGINIQDATQNGNGQLKWVNEHPGQWTGPYKWQDFKKLTSVDKSAKDWMLHWERPADQSVNAQNYRAKLAREWYEKIKTFGPGPGPGPDPDPVPDPGKPIDYKKIIPVLKVLHNYTF